MSKITRENLRSTIQELTKASQEKKRKFVETVELQIGLKNYDVAREKRFSGSIKLPNIPRPNLKLCILGDQAHIDEAKGCGMPFMSVDDLKKFNKNKKLIKKFAKKYYGFLASESLMRQIPRLLGPTLSKVGKFPTLLTHSDTMVVKADEVRATVKFQMKKVLGLGIAVGHVEMTEDQLARNINLAINFLVSLLKKNWQNIRSIVVKSTMGTPYRLY
jgi:large subunit ribosomal protein L10Ae